VSSDSSHSHATEEDNLLVEAVSLLLRRQHETEALVSEQISRSEERSKATEQQYADLESRLASIEDRLSQLLCEPRPNKSDVAVDERLVRLREQLEELKAETNGRPLGAASQPTASPVLDLEPLPADAYATQRPPTQMGGATTTTPNGSPPEQASSRPTPQPTKMVPAYDQTTAASRPAEPPQSMAVTAESPAPQLEVSPPRVSTGATAPTAALTPAPTAPPLATPTSRSARFWDLVGATSQERFGLVLIGAGLAAVAYAILTQLHLG
jgi:hypothetical protein